MNRPVFFFLYFVSLLIFSCGNDDGKAIVNRPPIVEDQEFTSSEQVDDVTIIGTVVATDPEEQPLTFSIAQNSNDLFEITNDGAISLTNGQALDFETTTNHLLSVSVSDGEESTVAAITINVTDANENVAPTISEQSFTVAEDVTDTDEIGTVVASDTNGDMLTFSITQDEDVLFEITEVGVLSLRKGKALNFETKASHEITVRVSDGTLNATSSITINISDVDENEAPTISEQSFVVNESIIDSDEIGTVTASDANEDELIFSIKEDTDALFEISEDGTLSLLEGKTLDFETKTVHEITIQVSDGLLDASATITIEVTDFAEIPFVTTWKVDNATGLNILINTTMRETDNSPPVGPTPPTPNYTVDWGDGNIETNLTGNAEHTYAAAGTYTVKITGIFPSFHANRIPDIINKLMTVEAWGDIKWYSTYEMFRGCGNLTYNATDIPDFDNVVTMHGMFSGCTNFNGNIGGWDVSNIQDMSNIFISASSFNQNISLWNVSNVVDFSNAFTSSTNFNQNLSNWNTSSAITMEGMFSYAQAFNQDISRWDVSGVTDMSRMFRENRVFNQDISGWDVSNVTNMGGMFDFTESFNQDISGWNVSKVTEMGGMFNECRAFNQDLSGWNVSNVTGMSAMFRGAFTFNQDISGWDVTNVTNMAFMFSAASSFDQDLSGWNTINVTQCANFATGSSIAGTAKLPITGACFN